MSRHTRRRLAVLLVTALVVFGGVPTIAGAQQFGPSGSGSDGAVGGTVRVDAGETYQGNLDAAAGSVVIAGTVEGDVSAAAGSVIVTDSGRVTGSLDAAAGSVVIEGVVEGALTVGGASLELREGSRVGGLEAGAADVRLDGAVDGDATVGADTFAVGPTATIGGSLRYDAEDFTLSDEASVSGSVTRDESLSVAGPDVFGSDGGLALPPIPSWVGVIYGALVSLLLGAVLLLAAPRFARDVVATGTSRALRSGGTGLLALVGTPIVLLLLLLTIVGIPLSIAGFLVFALLLWVTSVYGALVVGTWLLSLIDSENRWAALVVGVAVVALADFVPFVGGLVSFIVLLVGLGAFVLVIRERTDGGDDEAEGGVVSGETEAAV
ncbi:bactofilin family protein [Halobellus rarus]|uniref:Polymer-forming cytoskeletal protein n=1 Tax=Halobellus rarus TaxID=1126237 RepID=A0ABD6CPX0_9EURY|nr:polymer-forming cytoskeletal protein [Halobellus rarus]